MEYTIRIKQTPISPCYVTVYEFMLIRIKKGGLHHAR